jgi:hypothetical protein
LGDARHPNLRRRPKRDWQESSCISILANASRSNRASTNVPLLTNQFATPTTTARQNAFESDRKVAFLSRAVLLTDCKNGFSLSEFIGQIVEIVAFFPLVHGKECQENGPTAVGSDRPNAFGLDGMTGNEFEWVEDCWHWSYPFRLPKRREWVRCSPSFYDRESGWLDFMPHRIPVASER